MKRTGLKYIKTAKGDQLSYFNELKLCYLRYRPPFAERSFMEVIKIIADHYGKENQTIKAIEELAELIQALAKGDIENIKEEIADVRVMLEQIEYLYGVSDDEITLRMCAKPWRQLERMEGEND